MAFFERKGNFIVMGFSPEELEKKPKKRSIREEIRRHRVTRLK